MRHHQSVPFGLWTNVQGVDMPHFKCNRGCIDPLSTDLPPPRDGLRQPPTIASHVSLIRSLHRTSSDGRPSNVKSVPRAAARQSPICLWSNVQGVNAPHQTPQ